jgi:hypothetical protein
MAQNPPPAPANTLPLRSYSRLWAGGFLLFLPIVPVIATIVCIATYLGMNLKVLVPLFGISWLDTLLPLLVGTVSTGILWVLLSSLFHRYTAVDRINEQSYSSLVDRYTTLNYYVQQNSQGTEEVTKYIEALRSALNQPSSSWVLGKGYVELWALMDSAEEALIPVAPLEKVIAGAVEDEMCLNGSNIANSEDWANKLRIAVNDLDSNAIGYLKPSMAKQAIVQKQIVLAAAQGDAGSAPTLVSTNGQNGNPDPMAPVPANGQNGNPDPMAPVPANGQNGGSANLQDIQVARAILRSVRATINAFNAKSWEALIDARNQLYCTMTLVGLTVFVFVAIAILLHVNLVHLEAATFYAFIGGIAGLIGRLSLEAQSDKTLDNYRLSQARLLVTPLLSGLAAVIGVLIVAKVTDLNTIYNMSAGLVPNLIIAAAFGLSPNLLINQLQKKSDEYKGNLQSTQSTSGK